MRLATKGTETENLFETLANKSPVGLYIVQDGKFCYTNPPFQSTTGYTEDELLGRDSLELVVPEDRERVRENAIKMLKGELTSPYQFRVTHKNGSIRWIMESVVSVQYHGRRATLGDFIDITERKQVEEKVQHLNLVLRAIRNINQLIARGTDRNGLLKGACDTFVKTRGYYSAWIALLDESGKLVTAAEAGLGKSFLQVMERLKRGKLTHCGCKVLEKPGVLVMKDVSSECEDCPVAKEDTGRGAMSVRLEHGGKVYGLMTVSIPPGRAAEKEEHDLFEEIAGDIAFALYSMEQEQERKKAEESLQAEKNKLQSLIDSMEDTITIQDTEFNIIYQNEPSRIASGGDHVGEKCYRAYEGQESICEDCPVEKAFKDGKSHTTERRTAISGKVAFWENTANPIRDAAGRVVSCLELARDVTERKKAEEELSKTQAQLSSAVQMAHLGPWEYDAINDLFIFNDAFYELFHTTAEEVGGYTMSSAEYARRFVYPEDAHLVGEEVRKALEADNPNFRRQLDHRIIYANGEVGYISVRFFIVKDETGSTARTYGVNQDITERKQAEEALQIEKNKLQSVIDAMEDDLTIQDTEYNIIFQNEPARINSGGDRVGEKCYRAYEGRESICEDCPVEKAFKDGKPHTSERQRVLPSGEGTFWETTANPIRDAKGRVVSCLEIGRNITERKRAGEALQIEKNKLKSVIDAMADGLNIQDTEYNIIFQNEVSRISTGGDRVGEKCYRVFEGSDKVCDGCPVEEAFKDGKPHIAERMRILPSGEVTFWENTANPIRDAEGKVAACLEIGRNITERKKQEQALADELTRRRILVDQSLDGIVVLDVNAKVYEANQRFAEMLGYTPEEVRELHTWDWDKKFPPEKILEMGRNVDEKGFHLETQHTRKDGSVIDVDISINGAMLGGQKLIFCVGRDVTERKEMEEAIKHAAEEWRNTFDSISDAISIHDREFRILRANKAFADIFHMKPSQIIGKHCYELHKGEKPKSGCPQKQTLATEKPAVTEFYESHLGKFLLESTSPIFNEKGEVVGIVHVTRDITAQKQQNERLMMTDRLASIGELAAGTAHELNNPLTSVIGFSQLLMEKNIPDDIREDLKLIYNEAQRAASVTKNLLTFARKHTPVKQLSQINNIIEDVLKLRAYEHKVNGIEVKRRLAPDLPEIMVDNFQMQQVFLNIIINAEYFMIEAHKRGTLTITTKKQNGSTVRISIADDGPGIPQENLRRIFDPFFTTKEAGKGTGLGLSICHGIVAEHGGQIYARSQPGKGATIFVELPINGL
jgi:PAS domain S-box-containing protein